MSYFVTLDEMEEENIVAELRGREEARKKGVCDYCCRKPDTKPCKFSKRHTDPRISLTPTDSARC